MHIWFIAPILSLSLPYGLMHGWLTIAMIASVQVTLACFFRNSKSFSYAAVVTAITAVVMFTGGNTVLGDDGEEMSLARIVNTVLGICIYLVVDVLLGKMQSARRQRLPMP